MSSWCSYFARVRAANGVFLLGGVIETVSSRFELRQQARDWAEAVHDANEEAGRAVSLVLVAGSDQAPEIDASGRVVE